MLSSYLPSIASIAVMFMIGVYVALDGFDVGAGIMLMRDTNRADRDAIIASTQATRFSSEWWLIAAAAAMYFAFPFPFGVLAVGLAAPIVAMLFALAVRGLAAARRSGGHERAWSITFAVASLIVAIAQGFCVGGYIRGLSVAGDRYIGGFFDYVSPFSLLVAAALCAGYILLGAAWTMARTSGALATRAQRWTRQFSVVAAIAAAAISIAMLAVHPTISAKWGISLDGIDWTYLLPLSPMPLLAAAGLVVAFVKAGSEGSFLPFAGAIVAVAASYAGLAVSIWPYVVPYGFTAAQSAADTRELWLVLSGVALAVPCLVAISAASYVMWRGRQGEERRAPTAESR